MAAKRRSSGSRSAARYIFDSYHKKIKNVFRENLKEALQLNWIEFLIVLILCMQGPSSKLLRLDLSKISQLLYLKKLSYFEQTIRQNDLDLKFVFGAKDGVRFEVVDVADGPVGANKGQRVVVVLDVAAIDKNQFSFDFV